MCVTTPTTPRRRVVGAYSRGASRRASEGSSEESLIIRDPVTDDDAVSGDSNKRRSLRCAPHGTPVITR